MKNFTNGSLVLRVWRFDGESELIAKFAYYDHAKTFAETLFNQDMERKADLASYFYLAVCEYECEAKAFGTKPVGGSK